MGLMKDLFGLLNQSYLNKSMFQLGGSYIKLPVELKYPKKGLINMKIMIKNVLFGVMLGILIQ